MILRRVIAHFRRQEWTAIAIDFVIVVMGVFVGVQLGNWNTERARRVADVQYLNRLHGEVVALIEIRESLMAPRRKNVEALQSAAEVLLSPEEPRRLTTLECTSIHLSHVYTNPSGALPTVSELLSSGRFDSLSSQTVRDAIQRYVQSVDAGEDIMAAGTHDSLVISRKYPQYISVNALKRGDFGLVGNSSAAENCDVEGMRADQGFLNDLSDNKDRFDIYFAVSLEAPHQSLLDLHRVLDEELDITHAAAPAEVS